jgi:hypothetical protein
MRTSLFVFALAVVLGPRIAQAQVPILDDSSSPSTPPATQPPPPTTAPSAAPTPGATPAGAPSTPPADATKSSTNDGATDAGVGVTSEKISKVSAPGNSYFQIGIDGGFMYGSSTKGLNLSIYGGGADFNLMYRVGGKLPGPEGGGWLGFGANASVGIFGAGIVLTNTDNTTDGAGMLLINGGLTAGVQLLSFGKMDPDSLVQKGVGVFVGGRVGVADVQVFGGGNNNNNSSPGPSAPSSSSSNSSCSSTTNGSTSCTFAQYGGVLELSFPSYNAGTSSRSAFYIDATLLPTDEFLFTSILFGGSF